MVADTQSAHVPAPDADVRGLLDFVDASPTPYHAAARICARLDEAGATRLWESEAWDLARGGTYYVVRNDSSVVAFRVGSDTQAPSFRVVGAHVDSPALRIKPVAQTHGPGSYVRLNVEGYGSLIERSWLDRPLSIAGRLLVREEGLIRSRLVSLDDAVLIPSVAIHLNRKVNDEGAINRHIDLCPLLGAGPDVSLDALLAEALGIEPDQILARDLIVCNRQHALAWGAAKEFVSAPRLDDQQCAYASLEAFVRTCGQPTHADAVAPAALRAAEPPCASATQVLCLLDHEEVGSLSMKGARSSIVCDVLRRVCVSLGLGWEDYERALSSSFALSCDNAQGTHPNHPELYDEHNRVWLNGGVVVKENAQLRYATDGLARAVFGQVCQRVGVPTQSYANRSDIPCGTTIGSMLAASLGVPTVDVGLAQLAMHSSFETAGAHDAAHLRRALESFYACELAWGTDGTVWIS